MAADRSKSHLVDSEPARDAREIERVFRMPPGRVASLLGLRADSWGTIKSGRHEPRPEVAALLQSIVDSPLFKLRARLVDQLEKTDQAVEQLCDAMVTRQIHDAWASRNSRAEK